MDETIYVILKVLFDFALEVWFSIDPISIKVAQYYYFLRVTLGIFGAQGHDIFAFCLEFKFAGFPKPRTL